MDRVILNKLTSVDRCLTRIDEVYTNFETLQSNYTQQDAIILNIERACQGCIDRALHFVKVKKVVLPLEHIKTIINSSQWLLKKNESGTFEISIRSLLGNGKQVCIHVCPAS